MSKRTFETIDILIFSVISILLEAVIIVAYNSFGKYDGYIVSFSVVIGLISIYRWNFVGVIPALAGGVATILTSYMYSGKFSLGIVLSYTVGYMFLLGVLVLFKLYDKNKMVKKYSFLFGYYFLGYLLVEIGRVLCFICTGQLNLSVITSPVLWDLLNIVIGALIFFISIKQKYIVYDMNTYLIEQHSGTSTSRIRNEIDDYSTLESLADKDDISDISLLDGGTLSDSDLKKLNDNYRKMTKTKSKYDLENEEINKYLNEKGGKQHGNGSSN